MMATLSKYMYYIVILLAQTFILVESFNLLLSNIGLSLCVLRLDVLSHLQGSVWIGRF